jgi:hypothetical protein
MCPPPDGVIVTRVMTANRSTKEHIMRTTRIAGVLEHQPVSVRTKLAAAWTSVMFLYIYVDYLHLYKPGSIEDILNGVVWQLDITQTFVVGSLTLVAIPAFMVLVSTTLPARACRIITLGVASLYVPVSILNVVDDSWTYFYGLGAALEVAILAWVIHTAWTWPRTPRQGSDVEASRPLQTTRTS